MRSVATLFGLPAKGSGILNNELYAGRCVWNRSRWVRQPDPFASIAAEQVIPLALRKQTCYAFGLEGATCRRAFPASA
jgi:hypothetical protein